MQPWQRARSKYIFKSCQKLFPDLDVLEFYTGLRDTNHMELGEIFLIANIKKKYLSKNMFKEKSNFRFLVLAFV